MLGKKSKAESVLPEVRKPLSKAEKKELHIAVLRGEAPPISLLVEMYNDAKSADRQWLNARVMEIVALDIPKMAMLRETGYTIDRTSDSFVSCLDLYKQSMELAERLVPEAKKDMSATVEHSGERIAELVDSCISRIMMEDKLMNREAWMDILCAHAKLIRALMGITMLPESRNEPDKKS